MAKKQKGKKKWSPLYLGALTYLGVGAAIAIKGQLQEQSIPSPEEAALTVVAWPAMLLLHK